MDSKLRYKANHFHMITTYGVPKAVDNWACFKFSKTENHPYRLFLDHAEIDEVSEGVTHIACTGILHVRKSLVKSVHIIAHTIVFDEAPFAEVQISCHTLVVFGMIPYTLLKFTPIYPCFLRYIYSFASDFPFFDDVDAKVFLGDPILELSHDATQIKTCNDYAHGLNDIHLAAIQALTVREAHYFVRNLALLNPSQIEQALKIHTAPDVDMAYFRDERKLPSLTPFEHLPIKDLSRVFSNRSIYSLCKLISTPFLAGYRRAKAFDPTILPETLVEFMKETDRFLPQNNPMLRNTNRTDTPS